MAGRPDLEAALGHGLGEQVALHLVDPGRDQEAVLRLGLSTPSAVTCRPMAWPSSITARMMAAASAVSPRAATKKGDWSILTRSTLQRCRWRSEEQPVPKSSSAMRRPAARSIASLPLMLSMSSISAVSVISSSTWPGGTAEARSACSVSSTKRGWRSCTGETFTAMSSVGQRAAKPSALPQHPGAEPDDDAGLLGDGDQLVDRDRAAGRMLPAQQGLDAPWPPVGIDLGLVVQPELAADVEGDLELGLQAGAVAGRPVELVAEDAVAVPAARLGGVERDVGPAHQLAGIERLRPPDRQPDAGADLDLDPGRAARQREGRPRRLDESCPAPRGRRSNVSRDGFARAGPLSSRRSDCMELSIICGGDVIRRSYGCCPEPPRVRRVTQGSA